MTYTQKELPNHIALAKDATSRVDEARPPTSALRPLCFLHAPCVPDQILFLVSEERDMRGREREGGV